MNKLNRWWNKRLWRWEEPIKCINHSQGPAEIDWKNLSPVVKFNLSNHIEQGKKRKYPILPRILNFLDLIFSTKKVYSKVDYGRSANNTPRGTEDEAIWHRRDGSTFRLSE